MTSQWQLYLKTISNGIEKSIASIIFGMRYSLKNAKLLFLFVLVYFILFMLLYKNNSDFMDKFPFIGFFIAIIKDFIHEFLPRLEINLSPLFIYILMVLISAEFIKFSLSITRDNKKIEISDFYKIKYDLITDKSCISFIIASIVYWLIFYIPFYINTGSALWYLLLAAVIYFAIRCLFYGFFILDEEMVGPLKALKMSHKITKGFFIEICIFILVTIVANCILAGVITIAVIPCSMAFCSELSKAEILRLASSIGPIFSTFLITPVIAIAQANIYRSLKSSANLSSSIPRSRTPQTRYTPPP